MPRPKTFTREDVLTVLQRYVEAHGVAPTHREIRRLLGVRSNRTVMRYLQWLESEGDIRKWKGARGLEILRHDFKPNTPRDALRPDATVSLLIAELIRRNILPCDWCVRRNIYLNLSAFLKESD